MPAGEHRSRRDAVNVCVVGAVGSSSRSATVLLRVPPSSRPPRGSAWGPAIQKMKK